MKKPSLLECLWCFLNPATWRLALRLRRQRQPLRFLPFYYSQRREFIAKGGKVDKPHPILYDFADQAGSASGHYFHQDLLVASLIHEAKPARHIDIGSRVDGFVAHVASYRPIEIMDVRPLQSTGHKNILFLQADLMQENNAPTEITDSLSCLHTIEHFGLGRYTDPLMPDGHQRGFRNLLRMLKPGGLLYISFPIAAKTQVCFNAHRIFAPREILEWPTGGCRLELLRFDYVDDKGSLHQDVNLHTKEISDTYGCGIYVFRKHLT